MNIEKRLQELEIDLPNAPEPVAAYVPAVIVNKLVFTSGQGCHLNGVEKYKGKLGENLTIEEGYQAARQSILNCLAVLKKHLGNLNKIKRIVKVLGFVASAPGFDKQTYVINGASELLEEIFGENGKHARSAIGTNQLPFDIPVEIEMIVEIE